MKALILSGGNLKGAWQAGRLFALTDSERKWDFVSGTSVGALHALYIADLLGQGRSWNFVGGAAMNFWRDHIKRSSDLARQRMYSMVLLDALRKKEHKGLVSMDPLLMILERTVRADRIWACPIPVYVNTVDYVTNKIVRHNLQKCSKPILAAFASAMEPVLMPGVMLDCQCGHPLDGTGHMHQDGGVRDIAPLRPAIEAGASHITVILTQAINHHPVAGPWDLIKLIGRTIGVMTDETLTSDLEDNLLDDIAQAIKINMLVEINSAPTYRKIPLEVHRPLRTYPFTVTDFTSADIQTMLSEGAMLDD